MGAAGLAPASSSDIKETGAKWRAYQLSGDKRGKKKGSYRLDLTGQFPIGFFMDFRQGNKATTWTPRAVKKLTDDERRAFSKARAEERKKTEAIIRRRQDIAAKWSRFIWQRSKKNSPHPYLDKKGFSSTGTKVWGKRLVIPIYKDGAIVNLQFIAPDGFKRPMKWGEITGCYGSVNKGKDFSLIYVAEGYATARSVHEASERPCVFGLNAGNLKPVVGRLRDKYPHARIVVAADNDQWTMIAGVARNPGREAASEAAASYDCQVVWPEFPADDQKRRTDFNDLHLSEGLEKVKESLIIKSTGDLSASITNSDIDGLAPDEIPGPPDEYYQEGFSSREANAVMDWRELLICNAEGKLIKNSLKNTILFLQNHEDFNGMFAYDEFQHAFYMVRCPKWLDDRRFRAHEVLDVDVTNITAAMERFGLAPDVNRVGRAICSVSDTNRFHPAREYLTGLVWDQRPRLDKWLAYYMGAEDDDQKYLSFIGKKWLTAGVYRLMRPGCKFDHVLIAEGIQGEGKSTAFRVLSTFGRDFEEAYFLDNVMISEINKKDTVQNMTGCVIVELAELAGFSKKDDDEIKNWIVRQIEKIRLPYAKTPVKFGRQFILAATTNNYNYLKDPTGNRRYWPFKAGKIDIESLKQDREQLWAEAVHYYNEGLYIGPTDEEKKLAHAAQEKRRQIDAWDSEVMAAVKTLALQEAFNTNDIMKEMGLPLRDRDRRNAGRVSDIMQIHGWISKSIWIKSGGTIRSWVKKETVLRTEEE